MIIVNLDPNFEPSGKGVEFETTIFPSKFELNIKFKEVNFDQEDILITTRIKSSDDLMMLLLATDAIKRGGGKNIHLYLPYFPYARQDRQMVPGESLSAKVMADLLNQQDYSKIIIYDPHSDVTPALLNNCEVINNHKLVQLVLKNKENYLIVSPDTGAYKKIFKLCQFLNYQDEIVVCNKVRDLNTGKILNTTVSVGDLQGKDCYIVDDICSKGGTFIAISKKLKELNCGNVYLIVSHYEGSADVSNLAGHLDKIYTTNSMNDINSEGYTSFIEQFKL